MRLLKYSSSSVLVSLITNRLRVGVLLFAFTQEPFSIRVTSSESRPSHNTTYFKKLASFGFSTHNKFEKLAFTFPKVSIYNENNVRALSTLAFSGHTINIQDIFYHVLYVRAQGQRTSTRENGLRQFFQHIFQGHFK